MQRDEETKICSKCGQFMIRRLCSVVYFVYPPIHPRYWWCACGHTEQATSIREKGEDRLAFERWSRRNNLHLG